ncbi:MAG TPA: hypothetical protein VIK14_05460 [Ignavibacteria bacterium]
MKKYFSFLIIILLFSVISNAQYKDPLDYQNLTVGRKSTTTHRDGYYLVNIIAPIEHTASYSNNYINKLRARLTLMRNGEKIYSKIFI